MAIAPVEGDDLSESVTTLVVVDDEEVAPPFFFRNIKADRSRAVTGQGTVLHGSLVSA